MIKIFLALCVLVLPLLSQAQQIEIFTSTAVPNQHFTGFTPTWYALDAPEQLDQRIPTFSADPEVAKRLANEWIQAHGDQYAELMRVAYEPRMKALEYQIEKVPAIVFDGEFVVYGTLDVLLAKEIFHQRTGR